MKALAERTACAAAPVQCKVESKTLNEAFDFVLTFSKAAARESSGFGGANDGAPTEWAHFRRRRLVEIRFHSADNLPKAKSLEGPWPSADESEALSLRQRALSHWVLTQLPSATYFHEERGLEPEESSEEIESASEGFPSSASEAAAECSEGEDEGERDTSWRNLARPGEERQGE